MTEPVAGPFSPARAGAVPDSTRHPREFQQPPGQRGAAAPPAPASPTAGAAATTPAPSVQIAAALLRLTAGTMIEGTVTGLDGEGRPTLSTGAGLFAIVGGNAAGLSPGAAVSLRVTGADDTLSVLLQPRGGDTPARPLALLFLGAAGPSPEADASSRPLFAAQLAPAIPGPPQALTIHLAANPASAMPMATVTARAVQPDGTFSITLSSGAGTITVADAPGDLLPGMGLAVEIVTRSAIARPAAMPPPVASLPSLAEAAPSVLQFAAGRTALDGIEKLLLAARSPGLAAILPGLGQKDGQGMAVALLAAALKRRDFKGLIGDQARKTIDREAGPGPLLRAGAEFTEIARLASEPAPQGWRPLVMPFFTGHEIVPVVIFTRRQDDQPRGDDAEDETPEGSSRTGTRFMLELSLSELGPLQIDGFAQNGRIDTILRSRRPLDEELRRTLAERYATVLGTAGLAGNIAFQLQEAGLAIGPVGTPARGTGHISITA